VPAPIAKPAPAPERKALPAAAPEPAKPAPAQAATEPARPSTEGSAPPVAAAPPAAGAAPAAAAPAAAPGPIAKADPQAASPAETADDAGTLGRYRLALIVAAKRYKRYPRVAMDNNWEGRAEVRVVIGANGMIASISVKSSAGHEILDKQALDMIAKAKPLVPIPSALKGREFSVDVPVIFSLKEDKA
jgi:protein TonB